MKYLIVRVEAEQAIIKPGTRKEHDRDGKIALDAIRSGPMYKVSSVSKEVEVALMDEFKVMHPDFHYDRIFVLKYEDVG